MWAFSISVPGNAVCDLHTHLAAYIFQWRRIWQTYDYASEQQQNFKTEHFSRIEPTGKRVLPASHTNYPLEITKFSCFSFVFLDMYNYFDM